MPDTATRADRADATLALLQFATLTETHLADLAGLTAADLADMLAAADATRADRWPAAARLILDTLEARAARALRPSTSRRHAA